MMEQVLVYLNTSSKKFSLLSVNQLNENIKLVEVWKALNVEGYPLKINRTTIDK